MRGGSWNNNPRNVRCGNRNRNESDNRNNNIGFRLAVSSPNALQCAGTGGRDFTGRARRAQTCSGDGGDSIRRVRTGKRRGRLVMQVRSVVCPAARHRTFREYEKRQKPRNARKTRKKKRKSCRMFLTFVCFVCFVVVFLKDCSPRNARKTRKKKRKKL